MTSAYPVSTIPSRKRVRDTFADDSVVSSTSVFDDKPSTVVNGVDEEDDFDVNALAAQRRELDEKMAEVQRLRQVFVKATSSSAKEADVDDDGARGDDKRLLHEESQQIEQLGLKSAAFYRNMTQVEGILKKQLQAIHKIIESRASAGESDAMLPVDLINARVCAALRIQKLRLDGKPNDGMCICDETPCEGFASGCVPKAYRVQW